ncbi:MAG TPA: hypothetical protein VGH34_07305 [Vicinamibacterales bacterium]
MREVAKSMLGFGWAVSLFGVQQLSKVITSSPPQPGDLTAAEVEEVSRAVQSHLFGAAAIQFRAGDEWLRRVVDVVFDAASMQSLDPRKIVEALDPRTLLATADPRKMVQTGMTVIQDAVDKAVDTVKKTAAATSSVQA